MFPRILRVALHAFFAGAIVLALKRLWAPLAAKQWSLLAAVQNALQPEPPLVIDWIYAEVYWMLGAYGLVCFGVLAVALLASRLRLFANSWRALLFYGGVASATIIYLSQQQIYSVTKSAALAILLSFLLISLITYPESVRPFVLHLSAWMERNHLIALTVLVAISTIQRLISLYIDPHLLVDGDDPNTFFEQALRFHSGGVAPDSHFSPGMPIYLHFWFQLLGVGQFFPKLGLIAFGAVGLFFLADFVRGFFRCSGLALGVLIFYIASSHYVSFSNQLWNENLFHPLFSVFLWASWRLFAVRSFALQASLAILTGCLIFALTLLRSWFPLPGAIWVIFLALKMRQQNGSVRRSVVFAVAVLCLSATLFMLYQRYVAQKNSVTATTNWPINLLIGNNPYAQGTYTRHWVTFVRDYKVDLRTANLPQQIIEMNLKDPAMALRNLVRKALLWFFSAGGPRPISSYYQHPQSIAQYFYRISVFLLLCFGLFSQRRSWQTLALCAVYAAVWGVHMVFFADYRFTLTMMPIQAILACLGGGYLLSKARLLPGEAACVRHEG